MFLYSTSQLRQSACALILLTGLYMILTDSMVSAENRLCRLGYPAWSDTEPTVDRGHLFCGGINSKGRATGYHHRGGGNDTNSARIRSITDINSKTGVYVSDSVLVFNGDDWVKKRNISSFFPDTCSSEQVIRSIAYAAANIECQNSSGKWSGRSAPYKDENQYCLGKDGEHLILNGYWRTPSAKRVATAWPLIDGKTSGKCM